MEGWLPCGPGNLVIERHSVDYSAFGLFKLGAPGHGLSPQDAWAFASPSPCPLQMALPCIHERAQSSTTVSQPRQQKAHQRPSWLPVL